jgi:hypothetical protein
MAKINLNTDVAKQALSEMGLLAEGEGVWSVTSVALRESKKEGGLPNLALRLSCIAGAQQGRSTFVSLYHRSANPQAQAMVLDMAQKGGFGLEFDDDVQSDLDAAFVGRTLACKVGVRTRAASEQYRPNERENTFAWSRNTRGTVVAAASSATEDFSDPWA